MRIIALFSLLFVSGLFAGERFQYIRPLDLNTATYVANTIVNTPTTGVAFDENDRQDYVGVYIYYKAATATAAASGTFLMTFATSLNDTTYDQAGTTPYRLGCSTFQTNNDISMCSTNFFMPWARYIRINTITNNFPIDITNVTVKLSITGDRFAK